MIKPPIVSVNWTGEASPDALPLIKTIKPVPDPPVAHPAAYTADQAFPTTGFEMISSVKLDIGELLGGISEEVKKQAGKTIKPHKFDFMPKPKEGYAYPYPALGITTSIKADMLEKS